MAALKLDAGFNLSFFKIFSFRPIQYAKSLIPERPRLADRTVRVMRVPARGTDGWRSRGRSSAADARLACRVTAHARYIGPGQAVLLLFIYCYNQFSRKKFWKILLYSIKKRGKLGQIVNEIVNLKFFLI